MIIRKILLIWWKLKKTRNELNLFALDFNMESKDLKSILFLEKNSQSVLNEIYMKSEILSENNSEIFNEERENKLRKKKYKWTKKINCYEIFKIYN